MNAKTSPEMGRREFLGAALALAAEPGVALALRVADGAVLAGGGDLAANWLLPPGSTVKPFVLEALLAAGKLRAGETYACPGALHIEGRNFTCSHPRGLPPMDAARTLAYSCNCAVAHFAGRFAEGELAGALQRAGFRARAAHTILQALGEEGVSVSPLELARAYRRLAQKTDPAVLEGLEGAVQYGTARAAALPNATVAGKTGSALGANGLRAAWFAGFAPSRAPQVVVVVARQGRSGGADAAPAAVELFEKYLTPVYRVKVGDRLLDLPVERYVAAVLAGECSVLKNVEALKAMAVAARTYAAHERGRHWKEGFDFCNSTHCQRAEPEAIAPSLVAAAEKTAGEMLWSDGRAAFTPYTMSCGGMAESAEAVWPQMRAPYLRVHADPYCEPAAWSRRIDARDMERALRAAGLPCPEGLSGVSVLSRTASGRARELALHGRETLALSAGAFRFALGRTLGWNTLRSDFFEIVEGCGFQGKGEGHGVGLCQRGAERMAAQGRTYHEILAFYYRGADATNWQRMAGEGITVYAADRASAGAVPAEAERMVKRLPWPVSGNLDIYVYPTVEAFRNATNEPGWVAARTAGRRIDLQPARVLESRDILRSTLRHELLHVAVESRANPALPVWFREGIVEWLASERGTGSSGVPADEDLRQRQDRGRAEEGYRQARAQVAALIARYGEAAVLDWVARGLPDEVKKSSVSGAMTKSK